MCGWVGVCVCVFAGLSFKVRHSRLSDCETERERDTPRYLGSILLPNFGCFDWFNFDGGLML